MSAFADHRWQQFDNWSARAWFNFFLELTDPWIGADRVITNKK